MRFVLIALGLILATVVLVGCKHSPGEFAPKSAEESAVLAYAKSTYSDKYIVMDVKVQVPLHPESQVAIDAQVKLGLRPAHSDNYEVKLASPDDRTMITKALIFFDKDANKVFVPTRVFPLQPLAKDPTAPVEK